MPEILLNIEDIIEGGYESICLLFISVGNEPDLHASSEVTCLHEHLANAARNAMRPCCMVSTGRNGSRPNTPQLLRRRFAVPSACCRAKFLYYRLYPKILVC